METKTFFGAEWIAVENGDLKDAALVYLNGVIYERDGTEGDCWRLSYPLHATRLSDKDVLANLTSKPGYCTGRCYKPFYATRRNLTHRYRIDTEREVVSVYDGDKVIASFNEEGNLSRNYSLAIALIRGLIDEPDTAREEK